MTWAVILGTAGVLFLFLILKELWSLKERINHHASRVGLFLDIIAKDTGAIVISGEKKAKLPTVDIKRPRQKPRPQKKVRHVSEKQREAARLSMTKRWAAKKAAKNNVILLPHQTSTSTALPEGFGIVQ